MTLRLGRLDRLDMVTVVNVDVVFLDIAFLRGVVRDEKEWVVRPRVVACVCAYACVYLWVTVLWCYGLLKVLRSIQCWSDHLETMLQDCFDSEDYIDEYTDTVTEFIWKCLGDAVPTVTNSTQTKNLWIDGSIRAKLKA